MTNLDPDPQLVECNAEAPSSHVEVITPREVPLGGLRAMTVRRTLPSRGRSLIGAWCFADHYGPDPVADTGGMSVASHPHTGLQTVSWLFSGEIEHRDSAGHQAMVRPGELNLMTAGRGISHSEISTPQTRMLHGMQLWVALPDVSRHAAPGFEHFVPEPVRGHGFVARVFLGSLFGVTSPVSTYSPLVGAEVLLEAGTTVRVAVDPHHEHGFLVDTGRVTVSGREVTAAELGYVATGAEAIEVEASEEARLLVLGGEPFGEPILMWWNFVGRDHDEIEQYRAEWQRQIADGVQTDGRFGVTGDPLPPIPAPALPGVRLRPR